MKSDTAGSEVSDMKTAKALGTRACDINELPLDVSVCIFQRAAMFSDPQDEYNGYLNSENLENLTRIKMVCRHWRRIISDSPSVYSRFAVRGVWTASFQRSSRYGRFVEYCLEKSRSRFISFYIVCPMLQNEHIQSMISKLVQHSNRWKDVKIYVHFKTLSLFEPAKNRLNEVTSLDILFHAHVEEEEYLSAIDCFGSMPKLNTLKLSGDFILWELESFPWRQLDTLELNDVYIDDTVEILQQCVNLVHCVLCYTSVDFPQSYRFEKLRRLSITFPDSTFFEGYIDTPNLEELYIDISEYIESVMDVESIIAFLYNPCMDSQALGLKTLSLVMENHNVSREDAIKLATRFPNLASLSINAKKLENHMLNMLEEKLPSTKIKLTNMSTHR